MNGLSFLHAAALHYVIGDNFLALKIPKLVMIYACSSSLP